MAVQIHKVTFTCTEHTYSLIKAITNVYIDLRIRFECKNMTETSEYIRNSFHKLIHFKGQWYKTYVMYVFIFFFYGFMLILTPYSFLYMSKVFN